MIIEITVIKYHGLAKNDAMLLMLSIVMFYIFIYMLKRTGKRIEKYKELLLIYLFHPLIIIIICFFSTVIGPALLLSYLIMKWRKKYD